MIKIALCDDNAEDLSVVKQLLLEYKETSSRTFEIYEFSHPDELLTATETCRFSLYLLDIIMPMVNGIQAARELRWNDKYSPVVFITSEKSFALDAFDVNAVNYLLKPLDRNKFFSVLDGIFSTLKEEGKNIAIKMKSGLKTVSLEDVAYLEYSNHCVNFHMCTGEGFSTVTQRISFEEFIQTNIGSGIFGRCHESFLVNLAFIDVLSKTEIELRNGNRIPVSKSRYAEVQKSYLDYRLK